MKEEKSFINRLKALIKTEGVKPFARMCGVNEGSIRHYLKGGEPGLDNLIKIANACGRSVGWLATGEENSSPQEALLTNHPNREANPRFAELVDRTARIVTSKTIYRSALERNIDAFYKAVETEDEMENMRGMMAEMMQKLDFLVQENMEIKAKLGGQPKKREASNSH